MVAGIKAVLDAAEKLTDVEKLEVAARLLESHPADGITFSLDDPNLQAELQRRASATDGWKSWTEFRADIDADE